jgi:RNA polymerase sigma-70 factor (ECF subfamily)
LADDAPTDADLLARWRAGAEDAAAELARRHAAGLLALVRRRLSSRLSARLDAEDVVQSALRSFFVAARDGGLGSEHGGDLWRLLATVTLNKMHKVVRRHTVRKRSVNAEAGFDDAAALTEALAAGGRDQLSPLEALAILDQLEAAMAALPEDRRPILELRLAGHDLEAIAAAVGCSQRTVRRVLAEVKERLEREPPEDDP